MFYNVKKHISKITESRCYAVFLEITRKTAFTFFFCGFLGALTFIHTYGTAVLDCTYTDWLMRGADLSQHYLGWLYFRNSGWSFPIGLMDNIVYPFKESIVYTDSIPMFAIFFKVLSPLLPESFQYFGLFGITCYFLQGAVAGLIILRLCNSTVYATIGSIFFICSTVVTQRMFGHTSLSAHFILLLCIYISITKNDAHRSLLKNIAIWGGLLCLSASTHLYIVPMTAIFLMFYMLDDVILSGRPLKPLMYTVSALALMLMTMYVIGAFYSDSVKITWGVGYYNANINSLFNPMDASAYLREMPHRPGQYEGFAYIGLGIIFGLFLVFTYSIRDYKQKKITLRTHILPALLVLTFFIFALSPTITLGENVLFTYPTPKFVDDIWGVFKASGRFMWAIIYVITTAVIYLIKKEHKTKTAIIILAMLAIVQYSDLRVYMSDRGAFFRERQQWQTQLTSKAWDELGKEHKHIVFLQADFLRIAAWQDDLAVFVNDNAITTNDFRLARRDDNLIGNYKNLMHQRIMDGEVDTDIIYIIESEYIDLYMNLEWFKIYEIDGHIVGLSESFSFEDESVIPLTQS